MKPAEKENSGISAVFWQSEEQYSATASVLRRQAERTFPMTDAPVMPQSQTPFTGAVTQHWISETELPHLREGNRMQVPL